MSDFYDLHDCYMVRYNDTIYLLRLICNSWHIRIFDEQNRIINNGSLVDSLDTWGWGY